MDHRGDCCVAAPITIWPDAYSFEHASLDYPAPLQLDAKNSTLSTTTQQQQLADAAQAKQAHHAGSLSLHTYRKFLSRDDDSFPYRRRANSKLKRKNGAVNLAQSQASSYLYPVSVSSVGSSPPPLSPSYSLSVMSQQGEQELDGLDGFLLSEPNTADYSMRGSPISKLNTFRDRLGNLPSFDPSFSGHTKTRSDSVLFDLKQSKTTMSHHGALFEILNPRESLKLARIVSYIEDVDCSSFASTGNHRDSRFSTTTCTTVELDDPDSPIIQLDGLADIPLQEPTSLYLNESAPLEHSATNEVQQKAHFELVGDNPHKTIPSITERLETPPTTTESHINSPVYAKFHPTPPLQFHDDDYDDEHDHNDHDHDDDDDSDEEIGEPGYPIHEDSHITRQWDQELACLGLAEIWHDGHGQPMMTPDPQPGTPIKHVSLSAQKKIQGSKSDGAYSQPMKRLRGLANTLRKGRFCFQRRR